MTNFETGDWTMRLPVAKVFLSLLFVLILGGSVVGGSRVMAQTGVPAASTAGTSEADRIMGAVIGAACLHDDFTLVVRICRRTDGAEGPKPLLNHIVSSDGGRTAEHCAEHLRRGLPD